METILEKRCIGVYKIFAITVLFIVTYWFYLLAISGSESNAVYNDVLNKLVFNFPYLENCCSWWPTLHGILFFIIGLLFPDCDCVAIIGGILWEVIEVVVYSVGKIGKGRQGVRKTPNRSAKVEYSQNWWAGSFKDIFFNIVGFYLGKAVAKAFKLNICIPHITDKNCKKDALDFENITT